MELSAALPLSMTRILVHMVACVIACGLLRGEDSDHKPDPDWLVTAQCHMVVLPQSTALPLISSMLDETKTDAAWEQVTAMIDRGEAELAGHLIARGASNAPLVSESLEEIRYPQDWDPIDFPDKLPEDKVLEMLNAWPAVGLVPQDFYPRGVGETLLVTAGVTADGAWIDAAVKPQHVRLLKWEKYDAARLANGERLSVEQPYFHVIGNDSEVRLRNGQRILLGVHKVPEPGKGFELFVFQIKAVSSKTP